MSRKPTAGSWSGCARRRSRSAWSFSISSTTSDRSWRMCRAPQIKRTPPITLNGIDTINMAVRSVVASESSPATMGPSTPPPKKITMIDKAVDWARSR